MAEIILRDDMISNLLFYGSHECINDIVLKRLMHKHMVNRFRQVHYKDITYQEASHMFVFHASENENIINCIKELIKNYSVHDKRHIVLIFNIEKLAPFFFAFRIMLERFHKTSQFICTTLCLPNIERPIQSRFFLIRQPHDRSPFNPIDTILSIKKKPSIEDIAILSNKLKDHNLKDIILSALHVTPYKHQYIDRATFIENMYVKSKKKDKRAVIELLLIEMFYPSHKHFI